MVLHSKVVICKDVLTIVRLIAIVRAAFLAAIFGFEFLAAPCALDNLVSPSYRASRFMAKMAVDPEGFARITHFVSPFVYCFSQTIIAHSMPQASIHYFMVKRKR